jgi:ferredoxin-NADP reductase
MIWIYSILSMQILTSVFLVCALVSGGYMLVFSKQRFCKLRVVLRTDLSDNVFIIRLARSRFLWRIKPGQYVSLRLPIEPNYSIVRAYSVANWHFKPKYYELAIKKDGVGSGWLHANANVGLKIGVQRPKGGFVLNRSSNKSVVFIAGGIGITPIKAMIDAIVANQSIDFPSQVMLFYSASAVHQLTYHDYFLSLSQKCHWFQYYPTITRDTRDWNGQKGRLNAGFILNKVGDPYATDYYLCAGQTMMDQIVSDLTNAGVSLDAVFTEGFGTGMAVSVCTNASVFINGKEIKLSRRIYLV